MLAAYQVAQLQYPVIGNEEVIGNQRVGAGTAHPGDVPGIFDSKLRDRCESSDDVSNLMGFVLNLNRQPSPRRVPAARGERKFA